MGAGITTAAALLRHKRNRSKIYEKFDTARKETQKLMHRADEKKEEAIKDAKELLQEEGALIKEAQQKAERKQTLQDLS